MNKLSLDDTKTFYLFNCPHCFEIITVSKNELNCRIFIHAIYTHNYEQVNPHLDKDNCVKLRNDNKVYGCCLQCEIISNKNELFAQCCENK